MNYGFNQQIDTSTLLEISCPVCVGSNQQGPYQPYRSGPCPLCNDSGRVWMTPNGAMFNKTQVEMMKQGEL